MADDLDDWLREMRRDDRRGNYRLAGRVRLYSTMRWAEWANKRKAAQADLALAARLLYDLFSENASLRRDRDGLVQLVRDLQPLIGLHDAEMADRLDRFDAYVSCGYDLGAACHLLDSRRRPQ